MILASLQTQDKLQIIVSTFTEDYENMGLTLSIRKTKIFHKPGPALWSEPLIIRVHGEALENVGQFQYLRSVLSTKAVIDEEIQHHLPCASAAFGHLRKTEFGDNSIRSDTKLIVYRAVVKRQASPRSREEALQGLAGEVRHSHQHLGITCKVVEHLKTCHEGKIRSQTKTAKGACCSQHPSLLLTTTCPKCNRACSSCIGLNKWCGMGLALRLQLVTVYINDLKGPKKVTEAKSLNIKGE
eukprot:g45972.t1